MGICQTAQLLYFIIRFAAHHYATAVAKMLRYF